MLRQVHYVYVPYTCRSMRVTDSYSGRLNLDTSAPALLWAPGGPPAGGPAQLPDVARWTMRSRTSPAATTR
jgi:hypothetical protein